MAERFSTRLLNEEREFHLHELFFSTTDSRGVIRFGNDVFARVAGLSLEELSGSPHSIIRHPDMPRSVFRLFWEIIRQGKTIAAYVKNLAADGRYYWVLAVAMPIEDGFLSVRMKPSSELLPAVRQLYDRMLALERSVEIEPKQRVAAMEASTKLLLQQLLELGFQSYEDFMLHALATEISSRQSRLAASGLIPPPAYHPNGPCVESEEFECLIHLQQACRTMDRELKVVFDCLEKFKTMNITLAENSKNVLRSAESIRTLSMNATIAANKMGDRAGTLLVVADSLGSVSNSSQSVTTELASRIQAVVAVLNQLMFDVAATKLQCEVSLHFLDELLECIHDGVSVRLDTRLKDCLKILLDQIVSRVTAIFEHLEGTEGRIKELETQLDRLELNNRTLRFVQFAGKKESSGDANEFAVVFQEVWSHIEATKMSCESLSNTIHASLNQVRSLHLLKLKLNNSLSTLDRLTAFIS